jgi:prevent-host-death family protein
MLQKSISEAKISLSDLVYRVKKEPAMIIKKSKPVAVLISLKDFDEFNKLRSKKSTKIRAVLPKKEKNVFDFEKWSEGKFNAINKQKEEDTSFGKHLLQSFKDIKAHQEGKIKLPNARDFLIFLR